MSKTINNRPHRPETARLGGTETLLSHTIIPSQPGACHDANDATIPDQTRDDLLSSQAAGTKNPWNGVALKYRRIHLSSVGAVLVHRLFFSASPLDQLQHDRGEFL